MINKLDGPTTTVTTSTIISKDNLATAQAGLDTLEKNDDSC